MTYGYDASTNGKTRLTSVTATLGTQSYVTTYGGYDSLGRVAASSQAGPGATYSFAYAYNLAGQMELETFPSGRRVRSCYDSAGRISVVSNKDTNPAYATVDASAGYAAHGAVRKLTLGNNVVEATLFDSADGTVENNTRLQPTHKTIANGSGVSLLGLKYGYCSSGSTGCATNNGDVMSQTIIPSPTVTFSQTYSYDLLDRLMTATEDGANGWSEGYGYKWTNKYTWSRTGSLPAMASATTIQASGAINSANQVVGWDYDADGNLKDYGLSGGVTVGPKMIYDAENHMVSSTPTSGTASAYVYDGMGHRVAAVTPDQTSSTATIAATFVYNAMGEMVVENSSSSVGVTAGTTYLSDDTLGSTRLVTDALGVPTGRYDYLPFGEEIWAQANGRSAIAGYSGAAVRMKFTGKERDAETGLDYFGARYFSSAQGRFTGPDAHGFTRRTLKNPQKWNKYAYVLNNPLGYIDPNGLEELKITVRTYIPYQTTTMFGTYNGGTKTNTELRVDPTYRQITSAQFD